MEITNNAVNSFFLDEKNVLFFNIFIKNNKLYIITPLYKDYNTKNSTIKISYNSTELIRLEQITKAEYEATQILIYDFNFNSNPEDIYEIKVSFNEKMKVFMLKHEKTNKNKKLALTTLFKTDYKLNAIFYDYYKNQGVEHFYMYYNGKITDEIKRYYDKEDITLIEWDYVYLNNAAAYSRHYAQLGQMHDAMYRFGKDKYEYMLFCDLDEYLYITNQKLIDLVSDTSVDTFGFRNLWANTKDNNVPESFPNEFYVAGKLQRYEDRSKCIHKMDTVVHIGIHHGTKFKSNPISLKDNYVMFHFHSWGGANINRADTPELINLVTFESNKCLFGRINKHPRRRVISK
jgi:hypothetical protein